MCRYVRCSWVQRRLFRVLPVPASHIAVEQLAALVRETGEAHHSAYEATDGTDPEWASWYSGHLQALLGGDLGRPITRSEITYLLLQAEKNHEAYGSTEPWPVFYAHVILDAIGS